MSQAGCFYSVSPSSSIGAAGGSDFIYVYQGSAPIGCGGPTQDACLWTAQANVPWITIPRSTGRGDDRISFMVAANTTGSARTGGISVRDKTVVISQP